MQNKFGKSPKSTNFGALPKTRFRPPERLSRGGGFNPEREPERQLTGEVQGQKAAQGEERLARTIEKGISKGLVRSHKFRWTTLKRTIAGNHKELDELVYTSNGRVLAISVKGADFVHKGESAKAQDKLNELIIMVALRKLDIVVDKIHTVYDYELKTQELADKAGKRLGIYR